MIATGYDDGSDSAWLRCAPIQTDTHPIGIVQLYFGSGSYSDRRQYISAAELAAESDRLVPLGKMGNLWEIACAGLFLASDHACFISGACLPVDGGQHAAMLPLETPTAG